MILSRLFVAIAALVALTAFTDPPGHFTISFPKGWTKPTVNEGNIYSVKSPDGKVNCNAYATKVPALAKKTQKEINVTYIKPMTAAEWADFLGVTPDKIEVSEIEARPVGKIFLQLATIMIKSTDGVSQYDAITRTGIFVVPGYVMDAGCYATVDQYDAYKKIFEKTISSLKPL